MTTKQDHNIWPKMAFDIDLTMSLFEWEWTDSREGPEGDLARAWHAMLLGNAGLIETAAKVLYHSIRAKNYAYLERLRALRLWPQGRGWFSVGRGKAPVIELEGAELRVRGAGFFAREKKIRLSDAEITLLREAYFVRKTAELTTLLSSKLDRTEAEIESMIDKHVKLGTLVTYKGQVVSAVCDPEYLKQRRAAAKIPVNKAAEPPLVSARSLVRPAAA